MARPSHPPRLDYSNYTWRRVQITKLLVVQFSPVTSSLFGPNILLSTLFSNTLSLCSEGLHNLIKFSNIGTRSCDPPACSMCCRLPCCTMKVQRMSVESDVNTGVSLLVPLRMGLISLTSKRYCAAQLLACPQFQVHLKFHVAA
jgi:hypothetical protein